MSNYPRLQEDEDNVLILDLQGFGLGLVQSVTAYKTDWVEVRYHDGTLGWFRADMIVRVILKDRTEHEAEQLIAEQRSSDEMS